MSIRPDETVTFFPTAADFRNGHWHIPIHGWIYRSAELSRLRKTGLWLARRFASRRAKMSPEQMKLFRQRAALFLADNNRRRTVEIRLGDSVFKLRRSRANGHFKAELQLPESAVSSVSDCLTFKGMTSPDDPRMFMGRIYLLPAEGLSVISDIDDTIKITEVANRRKMLRNTFLENFAGVPEMAALYRHWRKTRGAAFHYVSASPWHLYPFLAEFLQSQGFPDGTFHLRDFRLMIGDLHHTLRPSRRIKLAHARALMQQFPQRKFILVGDSGESDAAIYARLFTEFPRQVEKICIRNISSETEIHWPKVCKSVPRDCWKIFTRADELR